MLKATIDENENACKIELMGNSLELASDLSALIMNFARGLMTKHSKDEVRELVSVACSAGIALALEEEQVR